MSIKIGLQTKIIVLVFGGLITIFAVFSYLAMQALSQSTQRSLQERLVVARLIAAHSDEHIGEALSLLGNVAVPSVLDLSRPDDQTRRADIAKLFQRSTFFSRGVFVVDRGGKVVWSEPRERFPVGSPLPGYASLAAGLLANQPQVSDLVWDPLTSMALVLVAQPISDQAGAIVGAVGSAGDLSTAALLLLLEPVTMGHTGYTEIVDRNGMVLASTHSDRLFQKDDHADRFLSLIVQKQPVVGQCHRCHRVATEARDNDVLAFSPLQKAPWGVALRQLEDEVLSPTREMAAQIVLIAVPLFALALGAAWITTRRIVSPIRALTLAAERIATGDLDRKLDHVGGDELGALGATFETMRLQLKTSYEEIEAWNRELEGRVVRRTRDLATVFEASQVAASTIERDSTLKAIVARLVAVIRQAGAGVLYLNAEQGLLVPCSCEGYDESTLTNLRLQTGEGIAGKVVAAGQAVLWPEQDSVAAAMADLTPLNAACWRQATAGLGMPQATIGVPLVAQGHAIGCLVLDSFEPEQRFGETDLALVQTIADRIAVAIENTRLYDELQQKEQLRGQLLEKVIVAQEEERRRIARELHDETGQSLTALAISLASVQESLPAGLNGTRETLERAKLLADKLLAEIRRLISDLRPTVLDDLGLVPALRRYTSTRAELLHLDIELQVEGRRRRLAPHVETALFRIVQEAVTNVAKHAEATRVAIKLTFEGERASVVVHDDGRGFAVAQAMSSGGLEHGVGLLGMRERVALLGGTLEVTSEQGVGTTLRVSLPLVGDGDYANE